ncbi:hypothetical protein GGR58DRAFT_482475 [Xylaria digitata]|nr:hypothetical protein GGR58DRAFT_482475 [Xylaria digitata]
MMDGKTHETDAWRQTCLDNESIYCPEPLPLDSNDIICRGSDDETDQRIKNAKTLRYEKHGRCYLRGEPLRILSSSLRGPFDKASGWQNPWLPKPTSQHAQCLENPYQPPVASSIVRYESDIPVDEISSEDDGIIQDVDDSMECHLPSPQSYENLDFLDSPPRSERRFRIESWAGNVREGVLEKDEFWAPSHDFVDHNAEPTGKRAANRDWLKRRPAKRQRPNASQSTAATSTPTPLHTAQLKAKSSQDTAIGRKAANRSFEMTTPSSSPNQRPREPPSSIDHQPGASYEEGGHPVSSTMPTEDGWASAPPVRSRREESQGEDDGNSEDGQVGEQAAEPAPEEISGLEEVCQNRPQSQTSHSDEEPEETSDFQKFADESFCYQARQLKRATSLATSSAKAPLSPKHGDAAMVLPDIDTRESRSNTMCDYSNADDVENVDGPNEQPGSVTIDIRSDHPIAPTLGPDPCLPQFHETMFQSCDTADPSADITYASGVNIRGPLSDITSNELASRLNTCNPIPQTILEVGEAKGTDSEPFFDEGVTLIGDPADVEEPGDITLGQQNPGYYYSDVSFLLQQYAISATTMANNRQRSQSYDVTISNNTNDAASYAIATAPQQEAVELQLTTSEPTNRSSQKDAGSLVASDETIVDQDEDTPQIPTEDRIVPAEQQSPWPLLRTVSGSSQPNNDDIQQAKEELRELPAQPIAMLDSPALILSSQAIRPSQQSPWTREATESMNATKLGGSVGMDTAVVMNIELHGTFPSSPLPEVQEHAWFASSPAISPVPGKPSPVPSGHQSLESNVIREEDSMAAIQNFPYTPVPQIARQSTPDGEVSIRSFSNFNFSSPQRPLCPPSNSVRRSILSSKRSSGTRTSTKSTRRVLFAPLPDEQQDDGSQLSTKSRAASPPPPKLVDLEEENVDGKYRNHFDAMNRRLSTHGTPNLRYRQRLLPSSSQQKPESPSVEAMARAFREADARQLGGTDNTVQDTKTDGGELDERIEERPQSPWQHDSEGIDDVAAVIGNLNQFLDVWDVDTEIDRNRTELGETGRP